MPERIEGLKCPRCGARDQRRTRQRRTAEDGREYWYLEVRCLHCDTAICGWIDEETKNHGDGRGE